jgi:uncharacterized protein YjiS (DUF1127 family)
MTTFTMNRAATESGLLTTLTQFWATLRENYARRRALNETRVALGALTDRELEDLGLTRFDIDRAAREAVNAR